MIVYNGRYYLYRHIRLDKNEPFYIGVGTKAKKLYPSTEYRRAYENRGRGKIWKDIVNKTKYKVEILIESDDYSFILQKEKEFIKLYGRKNNKTGILSNLTDGGIGSTGFIVSEETRRKIAENSYCKEKFGKNHPMSKRVYQYSLNGNFIKEWDSLSDIARHFNSSELPEKCLSKKTKSYHGYMWFYEYRGENIDPYVPSLASSVLRKKLSKVLYQYDMNGNFLRKWSSLKEIENNLGIKTGRTSNASYSKSHFSNGYFWFTEFLGDKIETIINYRMKRRRKKL